VDEVAWLSCDDVTPMLEFLRGKTSERKLRLFAAACVRSHWELLVDPRSRAAVELSERVADGTSPPEELAAAYRAAWAVVPLLPDRMALVSAARAAGRTVQRDAYEAGCYTAKEIVALHTELAEEGASSEAEGERLHWVGKASGEGRLVGLLREICGPLPFRPVALDHHWMAWNGGTVVKLAQSAYVERRLPGGTLEPGRLAILADALEEAGCTDAEILGHLRGPGPHYRGCHVVDLLYPHNR
jgi:hypothetical protein